MKKALVLSALVLFAGMAFAQRPVARPANTNSQATLNTNKTTNSNARVTANKPSYSYTITEMSLPNVDVMDAAATVRQDGTADKLKITVNGNDGINYFLNDANDQTVMKNYFKTASTSVDMSSFQPGEYHLQLFDQKGAQKDFKVIKKQK